MPEDSPIDILILGTGGREHSLAKACRNSPLAGEITVAPGNGGIQSEFACHALDLEDPEAGVALARKLGVQLVIIGPEVPLSCGFADALRAAGFLVYGPDAAAARLEASKAFAKDFFTRHGIPTAAYGTFSDFSAARDFLRAQKLPIVIKASGLAAGKGVIIAQTREEAESTLASMLDGSAFGESGSEVVIEEFLEGDEVSIHLVVSNESWIMLPPSQDHKRVGEGDTGPNTGGMGAYAPAGVFTDALRQTVEESIIRPTIEGLRQDGLDYRGTLYIGIILTPDGPKVLEFNVRFGDPETQVLLPLYAGDWVALFLACARGEALPAKPDLHPAFAMVVVLASKGYPGEYPKGEPITLPATAIRSTEIIHAGVARDGDGTLRTVSGRVLGAVGTGPTLKIAAQKAYEAADAVHFGSKYLRRDIGWRQLQRKR